MDIKEWLQRPVTRNILGFAALLLVYFVPDRIFFSTRPGLKGIMPYILLIPMYAWIAFHNRILFDKFYLRDKKTTYFIWTIAIMIFSSVNMHFSIKSGFGDYDTLPRILSFWIFTVTGLGIYILFKYRHRLLESPAHNGILTEKSVNPGTSLDFSTDGRNYRIPVVEILYLESMENYVKVVTQLKTYLVRLSMKEAEMTLPKSMFLRISRSHVVNTTHLQRGDENYHIGEKVFKIGKVYKKYVEEQLGVQS